MSAGETFAVSGHIVDLHSGKVFPGEVRVADGRISALVPGGAGAGRFLIPGFVDAHVHIESSLLAPAEFSRAATAHGTVATVSDPHEIANVLGVEGVLYMIAESRRGALKTFYGAPSCVPATGFETAGAVLDAAAVENLLAQPDIFYLSEVMNYPGVLQGDPDLLAKLASAKSCGKPIDGHAPGLRGDEAARYAGAGITTDHECSAAEEARDKIAAGMKILIREGSAARNFAALEPLIMEFPDQSMFCSDDLHPDALLAGHIDRLVRRAVAAGVPPLTALRVACRNPVEHYRLPVGLLREGDPADFLLVEDLKDFRVLETYIRGRRVAAGGRSLLPYQAPQILNRFAAAPIAPESLRVPVERNRPVRVHVIAIEDGQLLTRREIAALSPAGGSLVSDATQDVLKIAVLNRYHPAPPAVGFVRNFGLKRGAIASSVAHDSHNVIAVGTTDEELCRAINLVVAHRGGVCAVGGTMEKILPLPVAGLMSEREASEAAALYAGIEAAARALGSPLRAPLMTLSFLALLVIPELKLSDRGLFDGRSFALIPLIAD